jgi:nucleotide sugar dehydrogenase
LAPPKLAVVGQGYVGLPIAMRAVEQGYDVVGLDVDDVRIRALADATSFVEDVSGKVVAHALASGRYLPTTDPAQLRDFDFAIITVPTPLKETVPDLSYIEQAAETLSRQLRHGATVVLESTTYPGTTEELLVPLLEAGSGLVAGRDFHVGYSPERIDPGNQTYTFVTTPKVVAGIDQASAVAVQDLSWNAPCA